MDWRTRRQLTILGIFLAIILVISTSLFYIFFHAPATCFDEIKNQGEEEVDCGGPCVPCAFKHQKPVQVFFGRFIPVRPGNYDVVAEVQNPNDHLAANPLVYRIHLFDNNGAEIGVRDDVTYLYPNDHVYFVEPNFVTERTPARVGVEILTDETKWTYTNDIRPNLTVGNKAYNVGTKNGIEVSRVTGEITNLDNFTFQKIDVHVALLDGSGNIIAAAKTVLNNLHPSEKRTVEIVWPIKSPGNVAKIDMEAKTNGLDRANIAP